MIDNIFFELLQVALGTRDSLSRLPSAKEWKELYETAKKQSLVGVCFAGVQRLGADANDGFARIGISEMLYLTWMGMAAKIQQKNEIVNKQCVALQKQLFADGYRSCILKGQSVACLYTSTSSAQASSDLSGLRQSGDIDVLIDAPRKGVIRYVKKLCPEVKSLMSHHIDFPIWEDTMVEMHFIPAQLCNPFKQRRLERWYRAESERIFERRQTLGNGSEIVAPDAQFNLVYILLHIYKHLFAEGIGLRQLMDYYFVLRTSSAEELNSAKVQKTLKSLGLEKFAGATMWVLAEVFGLPKEYMICEPNSEEGKWLLEDIMRNGNMGHGREEWVKPDDSAWFRFRKMVVANVRLLKHYPSETLWFPYFKLWHYPWRKYMERKLRNNSII